MSEKSSLNSQLSQEKQGLQSDTTPHERQQLAQLEPAQRMRFYEQALVQARPIHISQDGSFSSLERQLRDSVQLTIPSHEGDTISAEAAEVFYSRNEFSIPIGSVPSFAAWWVGNYFRPSELVTRLAVLHGPPGDPGGGNTEIRPLISMPRLRAARLVFQDYSVKGLGAQAYLKPSAWMVMELKRRVKLTLQLKLCDSNLLRQDVDAEPFENITKYLDPLTAAEISIVESSREVLKHYRGLSASVPNILMENGWPNEISSRIGELYSRQLIPGWVKDQQSTEVLASEDVEML